MAVINAENAFNKHDTLLKPCDFSQYITQGQYEIIKHLTNNHLNKENNHYKTLDNFDPIEYSSKISLKDQCAIINIDLKDGSEIIISFGNSVSPVKDRKEKDVVFYFELSDKNEKLVAEYNVYSSHAINLKNNTTDLVSTLNDAGNIDIIATNRTSKKLKIR